MINLVFKLPTYTNQESLTQVLLVFLIKVTQFAMGDLVISFMFMTMRYAIRTVIIVKYLTNMYIATT